MMMKHRFLLVCILALCVIAPLLIQTADAGIGSVPKQWTQVTVTYDSCSPGVYNTGTGLAKEQNEGDEVYPDLQLKFVSATIPSSPYYVEQVKFEFYFKKAGWPVVLQGDDDMCLQVDRTGKSLFWEAFNPAGYSSGSTITRYLTASDCRGYQLRFWFRDWTVRGESVNDINDGWYIKNVKVWIYGPIY
ncbi:MAG: hypothetical protein AM324_010965 [Candidatus Thorarchaeota archaeon SMTZ1-83]|nr:MAG: hypothetical protein AM324_12280 [Candidatus Thorarchaeota archaeon SMTZ1-83]